MNETILEQTFKKETEIGWNLILPREKGLDIPNLHLNPMRVVEQLGVNAERNFVPKS